MSLTQTFQKNESYIASSVFVIVLTVLITTQLTYIDSTIFDFYVLPDISACYHNSTDPICHTLAVKHNCPVNDQMCLGNIYWGVLLETELFLAGFIGLLYLGIAKLVKRKLNWVRFATAGLWGLAGASLMSFGWEDYLYFATRNIPIPTSLPWLNSEGLIPYVMKYITHDQTAMAKDLYVTMALGIIVLGLIMYGTYELRKHEGLKSAI